MIVKGVFYKSLEENPEEPENYCILVRSEFEHDFDSEITVKDFIYYVINKFCYKCDYDDVCCEMLSFFKKEFENRFNLNTKKLNKRLIDIFQYRIKKGKPIIMIDCPEYLGGGCWGESNGLRYYINSNESIHMYEPHVHVQTFSGEYKDRFKIIECELMETQNNSKPLSNKYRKQAISFIKEKQIYFMEKWNEYTNCPFIIDIERYKSTGIVKFIQNSKC